MSTTYRNSLRWADMTELDRDHARAEYEAEKGIEHFERGPERPDLLRAEMDADYSGDRLLDGPSHDLFNRPIY